MSPAKPTRDDASSASRPEEMYARGKEGGAEPPQWARHREGRQRGDDPAPSNQLHPPHVTENDEAAPIQAESPSPSEVAALPANASGQDEVSSGEFSGDVNAESAYDGRPEEDKDQPPSERARESE